MLSRLPKIGDVVVLRKTKYQDSARGTVIEIKKDGVAVMQCTATQRRISFLAQYAGGNLSKYATIEE